MRLTRAVGALTGLLLLAGTALGSGPAAGGTSAAIAATGPAPAAGDGLDAPFYDYTGDVPLRRLPHGTVLNRRTVNYSIQGLELPIKAVQLLFRTEDQLGRAVVGATTVIRPLGGAARRAKVFSYQSFYDSLNPADQPSTVIAGGSGIDAGIVNIETLLFAPLLLAGYTINIPDTEGQDANFAAGREYGAVTLDSLRAISRATRITGVGPKAPIGLFGYSGGAIASEWAAEMARSYAPAIGRRIVGTAIGGVLVHPGHNLHYIDGSRVWAGVMAMALVGIARSFDVDLSPYLNARGRQVLAELQDAGIAGVLGQYPGLTWASLTKPRYRIPESVRIYVRLANRLIMGRGTPTAPMFIGQGTGGGLEGTPGDQPGIGRGDGVMIAGDVRSMARKYCRKGVEVRYQQYRLSHFTTIAQWLPAAYDWILRQFRGGSPRSTCGAIPPGNSLAPIVPRR